MLVLSLLAGAAQEMTAALQVNPHDLDGVADAIAAAATMPLARRRERWQVMMEHLLRHDIHALAPRLPARAGVGLKRAGRAYSPCQ